MSQDEEEVEDDFKVGADGDEPEEPLDMPDDLDFGLDEEDPDHDK